MTPVSKLTDLSELLLCVTAPTLADCISIAESWAKENGVTVQRYYLQKLKSKYSESIIADYVSA